MSIKDNAKSHYSHKLSADLLSVYVPEWGEEVFYKSTINGKQQAQIIKFYQDDKVIESVCMSLIVRALDKNGSQIWKPAELSEIMREYDMSVVSRVVEQISEEDLTVDEAKKP